MVEVRSDVPLAGPEEVGSHQHDVPVDHGHAGVQDLQIDVTAAAERDVQRAGVGAKGDQLPQAREEDARGQRAVAWPVGDARNEASPSGSS